DEVAERAGVLLLHELSPEARRLRLLDRTQRAILRAVEADFLEVARGPPAGERRRRAGTELPSALEQQRLHRRHPRSLRRQEGRRRRPPDARRGGWRKRLRVARA